MAPKVIKKWNVLQNLGRILRNTWIAIFFWNFLVSAHATDETLVRIAQTGRIVLGVNDNLMPLSYLDASGAPIGYHMDVCLRLVAAIRQRFDLPRLKVVTVPTTLSTRFALLDNRSIDIECGSNAVNISSLKQALLTHATMVSEIRVMALADNKDLSLATLGGKSVGVEAGGTAAPALRALTRSSPLKVKEVFGRFASDTFGLLESGRVDAVALATPYMLAQRALSAAPERYVLLDGVLRTDPIALMFRLQDENLHALANEVLAGMMKSGEMQRLYDKWFLQPIPGLPEAVGVPLPPKLRALFDNPGSEMLGI